VSASPLRLFFALWPDVAVRATIAALAQEVGRASGGRATAAALIHLTLSFLGDQPADRLAALHALAGGVAARGFVLALDEIGCFRRTRIAWLGASAPQPKLAVLHSELAAALRAGGFPVDERAYAPHLTLARRIGRSIRRRLPEPILWPVGSFVLVASELGDERPSYRVIAEWPLAPML
jgi:RNA 2',3'-cyclic 3'-phosphodiesterase